MAQSTSYENIKKKKEEINNQEKSLKKLQNDIQKLRKTYMNLVHSYYVQSPPFPENRLDCDSFFEDDLNNLCDLIEHCVISDNDQLLQYWLIKPLQEKKISILARQNKIADYKTAIEDLIKNAVSEKQANYYRQIKKALFS
jgi:ATP-dependent Lon protease